MRKTQFIKFDKEIYVLENEYRIVANRLHACAATDYFYDTNGNKIKEVFSSFGEDNIKNTVDDLTCENLIRYP